MSTTEEELIEKDTTELVDKLNKVIVNKKSHNQHDKEFAGKKALDKVKQNLAEKFEKEKIKQELTEQKELAEKQAMALAEQLEMKQVKELYEQQVKELADKQAKELIEKEAKELADKLAKELVEKEAKELADKEAKELIEKEAKELAEKDNKYNMYKNSSVCKFWEKHYQKGGESGRSSTLHFGEFKIEIINNFIKQYNIESLIDYGCGDGVLISHFNVKKYVGLDISDFIVNQCKEMFKYDNSKQFYTYKDDYNNIKYNLSLSLDVICHLKEDNIYKQYLDDLFNSSSKYIIIYSSNHNDLIPANKTNSSSSFHRNFTKDIEEFYPNCKLIKTIPQKYPSNKVLTKFDYYIYEK